MDSIVSLNYKDEFSDSLFNCLKQLLSKIISLEQRNDQKDQEFFLLREDNDDLKNNKSRSLITSA